VEAARHSAVETSAAPAEQVVADEAPAPEPVAVETAPLALLPKQSRRSPPNPPRWWSKPPRLQPKPRPRGGSRSGRPVGALGESGLVLIETRPARSRLSSPHRRARPAPPPPCRGNGRG
jgi:hypothetical protein